MEITFSTVWRSLIDFALNPRQNPLSDQYRTLPHKFFPYLLGIDFLLMFFLSAILSMVGVEEMDHEIEKLLDDPLLLAGMAIFIAPIVEEAIFRLPIGPWLGKYFKVIFWILTFGFAALHLTNFNSSFPIYLAPLLVLPQFFLGIMLGYIRVGWGFWYAVFFHATHNGILVGLALIGAKFGLA